MGVRPPQRPVASRDVVTQVDGVFVAAPGPAHRHDLPHAKGKVNAGEIDGPGPLRSVSSRLVSMTKALYKELPFNETLRRGQGFPFA